MNYRKSILEKLAEEKTEEKDPVLEQLASLEHDQWIEWSKDIAEKENLSEDRIKRWEKYWVPYDELTEEVKEQDRVYARKVLEIVNSTKESN